MTADDDRVYEDLFARRERRDFELAEVSKNLAKARMWLNVARQRARRAREQERWEPTQAIQGDARMVRLYLLDALAVISSIIEE